MATWRYYIICRHRAAAGLPYNVDKWCQKMVSNSEVTGCKMKVGDLVKQRTRGTDSYLGIGIIIEIRSGNCRVKWINPKYGCSWAGPGILELV